MPLLEKAVAKFCGDFGSLNGGQALCLRGAAGPFSGGELWGSCCITLPPALQASALDYPSPPAGRIRIGGGLFFLIICQAFAAECAFLWFLGRLIVLSSCLDPLFDPFLLAVRFADHSFLLTSISGVSRSVQSVSNYCSVECNSRRF